MKPTRAVALFTLAACALASAGCQREPEVHAKNESVESVSEKASAVAQVSLRPGRWESTMKLDKLEIAGLPPQARDAMAKQMGAKQMGATSFSHCLTPEQAARPNADFFQKGASGCTYDHFTMAGGAIDAEMSCKPGSGPTHMKMQGGYGPENYNLSVSSRAEMQQGMTMDMVLTITSRRVGECTGKEDS